MCGRRTLGHGADRTWSIAFPSDNNPCCVVVRCCDCCTQGTRHVVPPAGLHKRVTLPRCKRPTSLASRRRRPGGWWETTATRIRLLFVQGKGKSRKLVAPKSVGEYLERIHAISKATEQDDRVFTNITGTPAKTLYSSLIADLMNEANLREGTQGVPRSTYCFRHTYATLRLQEGVDVYFLAEQMGTSVHMIESHYGHVNTIKHADRVLQGMAGWELPQPDDTRAKASKAAETHDKGKRGQRHRPRCP